MARGLRRGQESKPCAFWAKNGEGWLHVGQGHVKAMEGGMTRTSTISVEGRADSAASAVSADLDPRLYRQASILDQISAPEGTSAPSHSHTRSPSPEQASPDPAQPCVTIAVRHACTACTACTAAPVVYL